MGRNKFKIDTEIDSMNMHYYLRTHEQKIRNEFYELNNVSYDNHFEDLLFTLFDIVNEEAFANRFYRSMQTNFLNLLNKERISKIRSTIRARRRSEFKSKKQLTIDTDVHVELKKYAKEKNQTLSDAIKSLLVNYYEIY